MATTIRCKPGNLRSDNSRSLARKAAAPLFAAAVLGCAQAAVATTISIASPADALNYTGNVGTPGYIGSAGYDFFDFGGTNQAWVTAGSFTETESLPTSLIASHVLNPSGAPSSGTQVKGDYYEYSTSSYSTLDVNSTSSVTGVAEFYNTNTGDLVQYTLGSSVPAELQIGLLGDNSGNAGNDTAYTVADQTQGVTVTTTADTGLTDEKNDFYFVDLFNAHAGDVIDISGALINNGNNVSLGGVTFDAVVPEPSSLGVLTMGCLALLARRRAARPQRHQPR